MTIFVHLRQKFTRRLSPQGSDTALSNLTLCRIFLPMVWPKPFHDSQGSMSCTSPAQPWLHTQAQHHSWDFPSPKPRAIYQKEITAGLDLRSAQNISTARTWHALTSEHVFVASNWWAGQTAEREKGKNQPKVLQMMEAHWWFPARPRQMHCWTLRVIAASICYTFVLLSSHCVVGLGFYGSATQLHFKTEK